MARGQGGSLCLPCTTLSFATPCRFIPALSRRYRLRHQPGSTVYEAGWDTFSLPDFCHGLLAGRYNQPSFPNLKELCVRKKITVVGAGNVGANCAVRIADKELADVVLVDVV